MVDTSNLEWLLGFLALLLLFIATGLALWIYWRCRPKPPPTQKPTGTLYVDVTVENIPPKEPDDCTCDCSCSKHK